MAFRSTLADPGSRRGSALGPFLLGVLLTIAALFGGGYLYLRYGHPPVAAADPAFPMEAQIVHIPLSARIAHELAQPPISTSEDGYEAGAKLYVANCAGCHGVPGHESKMGKYEYPRAPQLWRKHATGGVVGVSDDEAGETYWKIKNGIRLTGMPAYNHVLSAKEMWDVSLLLKNADQPLPDPVAQILNANPAP